MNITDTIIAVSALVTGTGGIKLFDVWLQRHKQKTDDSRGFRDELREQATELRVQVEALKDEINEKEAELDEWKERYWKLYVEHNLYQVSVNAVLLKNGIDPSAVIPKQE